MHSKTQKIQRTRTVQRTGILKEVEILVNRNIYSVVYLDISKVVEGILVLKHKLQYLFNNISPNITIENLQTAIKSSVLS